MSIHSLTVVMGTIINFIRMWMGSEDSNSPPKGRDDDPHDDSNSLPGDRDEDHSSLFILFSVDEAVDDPQLTPQA